MQTTAPARVEAAILNRDWLDEVPVTDRYFEGSKVPEQTRMKGSDVGVWLCSFHASEITRYTSARPFSLGPWHSNPSPPKKSSRV